MQNKLAYTAGLMDADGYFGIMKIVNMQGYKGFTVAVKLASTTPIITNFLLKEYGGWIDKPRWANPDWKSRNNKPASTWQLKSGKEVIPFLKAIRPYLLLKQERADVLIEYIDKTLHKRTPKAEALRKKLYWKIRRMNHRGRQPLATTE